MTKRIYQFDKLIDPVHGCGYAKYWDWSLKKYGRWLFREAIQERTEDLQADPWWTGNEPDLLPE